MVKLLEQTKGQQSFPFKSVLIFAFYFYLNLYYFFILFPFKSVLTEAIVIGRGKIKLTLLAPSKKAPKKKATKKKSPKKKTPLKKKHKKDVAAPAPKVVKSLKDLLFLVK